MVLIRMRAGKKNVLFEIRRRGTDVVGFIFNAWEKLRGNEPPTTSNLLTRFLASLGKNHTTKHPNLLRRVTHLSKNYSNSEKENIYARPVAGKPLDFILFLVWIVNFESLY